MDPQQAQVFHQSTMKSEHWETSYAPKALESVTRMISLRTKGTSKNNVCVITRQFCTKSIRYLNLETQNNKIVQVKTNFFPYKEA